mmetsp:Transcript_38801/g.77297  ORF Transcript_38801/g.77297 Transcript_38801/m.77297 type:complete len:100 (+) Transcript_38801:1137-1436(+)
MHLHFTGSIDGRWQRVIAPMDSTSNMHYIAALLAHQLHMRNHWHDRDFAFNISVRAARRERGTEAMPVIVTELEQMVSKGVWHGVNVSDLTQDQRKGLG